MNKYKQQKTFQLKSSDIRPKWFVLDAAGKTLGRLASEITKILRGKHRPTFTTYIDGGDGVIVINAAQVVVTGNKAANKIYRQYTGFMGGMREIPYRVMAERKPEYIIEHAVKCMMPRTRIGDAQLKKLRVFAKAEHAMQAQQPITAHI